MTLALADMLAQTPQEELEISRPPPFWFDWLPEAAATWLKENQLAAQVLGLAALLLINAVLVAATRWLVLPFIRRAVKHSRFQWDDAFVDHGFFRWVSHIVPALITYYGIDAVPFVAETVSAVARAIAAAFISFVAMMSLGALLNGINTIWSRRDIARSRPIKGYVQVAKIFVYVTGSLVMVANLFGQDPWSLMAGVGAMTAVLLLIFKDTILSLVASIQLTSNDMVRVGDWIEMPKFGADGDVIDIALHTVKVQNWDKTVTTIPTYAMISESFKNWRGMQESGGRRIKRSINIDMSTVRFLTDAEIDELGKIDVLADYMARKRAEIAEYNSKLPHGDDVIPTERRLTNLGTFRAYVEGYLKGHPAVHRGMTFLVRQLHPSPHGLPIEIYLFTNTTRWNEYEGIQADIFDHLLAVIDEFGLGVYQRPAGSDVMALSTPAAATG